jgi:tetratricopeptide (TPR) repeat protein
LNTTYEKGNQNASVALKKISSEWLQINKSISLLDDHYLDKKFADLCVQFVAAGGHLVDLFQSPHEHIEWAFLGLNASRILNRRSAERLFLLQLGKGYAELGFLDKAEVYYSDAAKISSVKLSFLSLADLFRWLIVKVSELLQYIFFRNKLKVLDDLRQGNMDFLYIQKGEFREAIDFFNKSLSTARSYKNRRNEALWLNGLGEAYFHIGDFSAALNYHGESLNIAESLGEKRIIIYNNYGFGEIYREIGDYEDATKYFERAIRYAEEIGDEHSVAGSKLGLAMVSAERGDWEQSRLYGESSLEILKKRSEKRGEGRCYIALAQIATRSSDLVTAEDFAWNALDIAREIGDVELESQSLIGLGLLYAHASEFNKSEMYLKDGIEIARKIESRSNEIVGLINLANLYQFMSEFKLSEDCLNEVLWLTREAGTIDKEGQVHMLFGQLYAFQNEYEYSVRHYEDGIRIAKNTGNPFLEAGCRDGLDMIWGVASQFSSWDIKGENSSENLFGAEWVVIEDDAQQIQFLEELFFGHKNDEKRVKTSILSDAKKFIARFLRK